MNLAGKMLLASGLAASLLGGATIARADVSATHVNAEESVSVTLAVPNMV